MRGLEVMKEMSDLKCEEERGDIIQDTCQEIVKVKRERPLLTERRHKKQHRG